MDWNKTERALDRIKLVTPYAGVWIEMVTTNSVAVTYCHSLRGSVDWNKWEKCFFKLFLVTPYAGVWIEIQPKQVAKFLERSLPTRECGLKLFSVQSEVHNHDVTPYAGVWIEIMKKVLQNTWQMVTPYAGVWIEIHRSKSKRNRVRSLPTRECGLKYLLKEIHSAKPRHSLRGSVDWNLSLQLDT